MRMGEVSITGESGQDYEGDPQSGFILGENRIPVSGSECTNLQWVERIGEDSEGNMKTFKVLAFGNCGGARVEEDDCCSLTNLSEFQQCIYKQYGSGSPEYICASGGSVDTGNRGVATGSTACAYVITQGAGSNNYWYLCLADFDAVKNGPGLGDECLAAKQQYSSWLSGDYKRWACHHETPVVKNSSSGGTSPSTCTWKQTGTVQILTNQYSTWENSQRNSGALCSQKGATPGSQSNSLYGSTCYYVEGKSNWTEINAGQTIYKGVIVPALQCQ